MHDHAEIKVGSEGLESIDATTLPANELRKSTKRDAAKSNASVAAAHPNEGDSFTGFDPQGSDLDDYLPKCFLFLDGSLTRLSAVRPWAREARSCGRP